LPENLKKQKSGQEKTGEFGKVIREQKSSLTQKKRLSEGNPEREEKNNMLYMAPPGEVKRKKRV